jgi:type IV pilus assembly protein PilE
MFKMQKKLSAFTLLELMVTMAIIGVLIGLAVFGISVAQRNSRDTSRKAALQSINVAIQDFYTKNNNYPGYLYFNGAGGINVCASNAVGSCSPAGSSNVPLTSGTASGTVAGTNNGSLGVTNGGAGTTKYYFSTTAATDGYVLGACLESNVWYDAGTSNTNKAATTGGLTCP